MAEKSSKITSEWLKGHKSCSVGLSWFMKHFPSGGDIDSALVMVATDEDADGSWVSWLMTRSKYSGVSWLEGLEVTGSLDLRGSKVKVSAVPKHLKSKVIS
jgi:hypothetical protein